MLIVHVHIHVKTECIDAFKAATLVNARASLQEPGVLRFDVLQQADEPSKFVLVEVYRDAMAATAHKETPHYAAWRDTAPPMLAEPRYRVNFNCLSP
ncbi:MAG TPA: putative quinol monooxygenase [Candidatus Acidoferrales bacterium]|nr:putative quinol monooxygenase [Candidatus Acidoferrales bacterium]